MYLPSCPKNPDCVFVAAVSQFFLLIVPINDTSLLLIAPDIGTTLVPATLGYASVNTYSLWLQNAQSFLKIWYLGFQF